MHLRKTRELFDEEAEGGYGWLDQRDSQSEESRKKASEQPGSAGAAKQTGETAKGTAESDEQRAVKQNNKAKGTPNDEFGDIKNELD